MASHDYRKNNRYNRPAPKSGGVFKWMLITGLLIGLVVFAVYLKGGGLKKLTIRHAVLSHPIVTPQAITPTGLSPETVEKLEEQPDVNLSPEAATELANGEMPQFDFYTLLPEKEVVVPDHEIITRTSEERVNLTATVPNKPSEASTVKSTTTYIMQAGSFKNLSDAEKMRVNLDSMGIESRVERAKVGDVVWNRVKMGPYAQMSSVSTIRARLRQNGIEVIVTETGVR